MAAGNLVARESYLKTRDHFAWFSLMAIWLLPWILWIFVFTYALPKLTRATEHRRRWKPWLKSAFWLWMLYMALHLCLRLMYTYMVNTAYNSEYRSNMLQNSDAHIWEAYLRNVKRLEHATRYMISVSYFVRDNAIVVTFLALVYLSLDITAAQLPEPRGTLFKYWAFLLAGFLGALSVVEFGLDLTLDYRDMRLERNGNHSGIKPDNPVYLREKSVEFSQMVLFEVSAVSNLTWAIVVAVRSRGQPKESARAVRSYLVASVGLLLYTSFTVFDGKERYHI